jgi:phage repressor protein C with HTH and peptisase S24 domain
MIPLISSSQAKTGRMFADDGNPLEGPGWEEIDFPDFGSGEKVYALEVAGDAMLPLYRDGDILILSPTAGARKGDRVVVRMRAGDLLPFGLKRRTAKSLELASLDPSGEDRVISTDDVEWVARIMWARQ